MMRRVVPAVSAAGVAVAVMVPAAGTAQILETRIRSLPDGHIRLSFPARDGVCGMGEHVIDPRSDAPDWEPDCAAGPVRVVLGKEQGAIRSIRTYLGGRWREDARGADLGMVSGPEAAAYFLSLVRNGEEATSRRAVHPASLARDAVIWPGLLDVARDTSRPDRTRRRAVQELARQASVAVGTSGVNDSDREIREQAIFAVSRLPRRESVPRLIEIAESHRLAYARSRALFWLGQTGDPRALDVFERALCGAARPPNGARC